MKKKAITFLDILIAATIIVVAMIPILGMLSRQTIETDKNITQAYAINKATDILNTLLDNVSFVAIREGNPGYLRVDDLPQLEKYKDLDSSWVKKMSSILFNNTKEEPKGYQCRGIIKDSKGINYLIHLRVEDIFSTVKHNKPEQIKIGENYPHSYPNEFSQNPEIYFSF